MTDYRHEIRALIDPEQTEGLLDGGLLQHVSVIMVDDPPADANDPVWRPPAAVTLRPGEALQRVPGHGLAVIDGEVPERLGEVALAGPAGPADAQVLRAGEPFQRAQRVLGGRRDR